METIDKATAQRMAYFGAKKMAAQGYKIGPIKAGNERIVTSPERKKYTVRLAGATRLGTPIKPLCHCAFFLKTGHGVCKHTYFAAWETEAENAAAATLAESEEWAALHAENAAFAEGPEGCVPHPHVPGLGA